MRPPSIFSGWLTHRRNVDLPLPDGPTMTATSRGGTSRVTPRSTWLEPKRLWTFIARTALGSLGASVDGGSGGAPGLIAPPPAACAAPGGRRCGAHGQGDAPAPAGRSRTAT